MTLARRIIAQVLVRGGRCVKGVQFKDHRDVGDPATVGIALADQGIDEIIFLNIDQGQNMDAFCSLLKQFSERCFIPVAAGGGLQDLRAVKALFDSGADKVVLGTRALAVPRFLRLVADNYGSQAVVLGIHYKGQVLNNGYGTPPGNGEDADNFDAIGELLLQSIDRDGMRTGYDLDTLKRFASLVCYPVLVSGGAGKPEHLAEAFRAGADGCVVATMFHFTDQSPVKTKACLRNEGLEVRPW